jgi:hypothetical protein
MNHRHQQDPVEMCQECSTELYLGQCGLCDSCRLRREEEDAVAAHEVEADVADGWSI